MKRYTIATLVLMLLTSGVWLIGRTKPLNTKTPPNKIVLVEGDILFQSSEGGQGKAIQLATGSKYNHCGVLYVKGTDLYVLEANGPVGLTPYADFIKRTGGEYRVKRLKNRSSYFNDSTLKLFKAEGNKYKTTPYDPYFGWNDSLIYCSELVWKIYNRALGLEVGKLQKLKEFNLTHPIVKAKLEERFGKNIPYDEKVISPAAIFESDLLETVR